MNRLVARDGAFAVSGLDGLISPAYWVLQPRDDFDVRFVDYVLHSSNYLAEITARSKAMPPAQFDLPWEQFRTLPIASPQLPIQRLIADYLDVETTRIDALIEKKQRLIKLVDQRNDATYLRLVLGEGLSGRSSTTGYYASVPDGWWETTLRHLGCEVQTGPFGSQLHADDYIDNGWPVVNPMNIVKSSIEAVSTMTVSDEKRTELSRHVLLPGDIVFGRRGEMGRAGLVEERHAGWLCGTGSLRLRIRGERLLPEYLKLLLGTAPARAYFELASVGSTMDNLNSEIVLAFPCIVPPLEAQREIARHVASLDESIRRLRDPIVRQIGLLREHRQALITAAVTGEFEVPGVVA